jgi:hypothetical protein
MGQPKEQVIGDVQKNENNFIRVEIKTYKNSTYLDIRHCYYDQGGNMHYTTKGIVIMPVHLSSIREFLEEGERLFAEA